MPLVALHSDNHVDDLMSSHIDPKVNDDFLKWLNKMCGDLSECKATRGKIHDFLGVEYDFSEPGTASLESWQGSVDT